MCLYPKFIFNKKYTNTKKNGGVIPPINDMRTLYIPVGCQKCIECRKQKAREWQVRLLEDIKTNTGGKFITLTFSNESYKKLWEELQSLGGYTLDNGIATLAVRRFLGRYRKKYGKSIRHWLVSELGHEGTENIHLHGIVWPNSGATLKDIEEMWQYGYVWKEKIENGISINYVNDKTIGYVTKYVSKIDEKHQEYKSIILTSPGIGGDYTSKRDSEANKFNDKNTNETYRTRTGHKIGLPIYWRNKIYSDEEKEKLWLQKLDKNVRFIRGEKYDTSKTHDEYFKALKWHRLMNKELGYGDDQINYEQKIYEEQLRKLKQLERIKKAKE